MPVRLSEEVLGVVSEHICKFTIVVTAEGRIDLVLIEGLLEVDGDLGSDLGEHACVHASICGFLEEEILGLRKT